MTFKFAARTYNSHATAKAQLDRLLGEGVEAVVFQVRPLIVGELLKLVPKRARLDAYAALRKKPDAGAAERRGPDISGPPAMLKRVARRPLRELNSLLGILAGKSPRTRSAVLECVDYFAARCLESKVPLFVLGPISAPLCSVDNRMLGQLDARLFEHCRGSKIPYGSCFGRQTPKGQPVFQRNDYHVTPEAHLWVAGVLHDITRDWLDSPPTVSQRALPNRR